MHTQLSRTPFPVITYNLRANDSTSDRFYHTLRIFSKEVLDRINSSAESTLRQYSDFVTQDLNEPSRSIGEYAVEFLTLGVTWKRYCSAAQRSSRPAFLVFKMLNSLRKKCVFLKPCVDQIRGKLSSIFLIKHIGKTSHYPSRTNLKTFCKLVQWLESTGEFKDEVKRLQNWITFFKIKNASEVNESLCTAVQTGEWFEVHAYKMLGAYTTGVSGFLSDKHPFYKGREDELFCGKHEIEYFVNMVASEIMNLGLRSEFVKTKARVVLVPGCMRAQPEELCKARREGDNILCSACTETCNVYRIARLGRTENFKTYIIPHSSGFTRWLKRWENSIEYGIIAIACPLNIAAGGYEMRELNIPSQCVMLDYCGCRKHWDKAGFATDVNTNQIVEVVRQ